MAGSSLLPDAGHGAADFESKTLPYFAYFEAQGRAGKVKPEVDSEELRGRDDKIVVEDITNARLTYTATFYQRAGGTDPCLHGYVKSKVDPDDADNLFEDFWWKIADLDIGPAINGKPVQYTMTLVWRQEYQDKGAADPSELVDMDAPE